MNAQTARPSGLMLACTVAATAMLLGCTKQVVVETTFPDPVIEELPLDAGVYYPEGLTEYGYAEDLPNDLDWEFELGDANVRMMNRALGALFRDLVPVDGPGGSGAPFDQLDLVIHPTVEAFEFSLPRQSRSDQYAVWIRYNLAIYTPDGQLITNWPVSAYGQADSRLFRGSGAMEAAVVSAMRDAIANIVIGLPENREIVAALLPDRVVPAAEPPKELAADPSSAEDGAPAGPADNDNPNESDFAPVNATPAEIQS